MLVCENLTIGYDGKVIAQDINFTAQEGNYICIVGENGSGKSTLIKCLLNLITPMGGKISLKNGMHSRDIGYLPQQTVVQRDFPASVTEVVLTGCLGRGAFSPFYSRAQKKCAEENMALLGVTPFAKKSFRELSGGQQQRVLLARALCATKKLLILDEPASVLDPVVTHELYSILRRLNVERGITILMVSHDIHCALEQARTILHMGRTLLFDGSVDAYCSTDLYRRMIGSCDADAHMHPHRHHHHHEHTHKEQGGTGNADMA